MTYIFNFKKFLPCLSRVLILFLLRRDSSQFSRSIRTKFSNYRESAASRSGISIISISLFFLFASFSLASILHRLTLVLHQKIDNKPFFLYPCLILHLPVINFCSIIGIFTVPARLSTASLDATWTIRCCTLIEVVLCQISRPTMKIEFPRFFYDR